VKLNEINPHDKTLYYSKLVAYNQDIWAVPALLCASYWAALCWYGWPCGPGWTANTYMPTFENKKRNHRQWR